MQTYIHKYVHSVNRIFRRSILFMSLKFVVKSVKTLMKRKRNWLERDRCPDLKELNWRVIRAWINRRSFQIYRKIRERRCIRQFRGASCNWGCCDICGSINCLHLLLRSACFYERWIYRTRALSRCLITIIARRSAARSAARPHFRARAKIAALRIAREWEAERARTCGRAALRDARLDTHTHTHTEYKPPMRLAMESSGRAESKVNVSWARG